MLNSSVGWWRRRWKINISINTREWSEDLGQGGGSLWERGLMGISHGRDRSGLKDLVAGGGAGEWLFLSGVTAEICCE